MGNGFTNRKSIEAMRLEGFDVVQDEIKLPVERDDKKPRIASPLEKRLENWRKTVRDTGNTANAACAFWAKEYVALRNKQHEAIALKLKLDDIQAPVRDVDADLLDGWLVETLVRSMIDFNEKQALRYRYVFNYPDHWIKSKLCIRDSALRIVFDRALKNLATLLDSHVAPVRIRTYNLHAGVDPRLEAKAVPDGTVAPLEKWADEFKRLLPQHTEALIDD